ncbi:unnamed protein product [Ilex paraguariensis]|uniref:Inositol polyphosphate-related phosphatase domain-containing protein n=1 Tax=Ilex paraguariensis TaxID=185542 RepID=A0ABC8ST14_9AQUA
MRSYHRILLATIKPSNFPHPVISRLFVQQRRSTEELHSRRSNSFSVQQLHLSRLHLGRSQLLRLSYQELITVIFPPKLNMKTRSKGQKPALFWPRIVMRKWLNINTKDSDYSADPDDDDNDDSDAEEHRHWPRESRFKNDKSNEAQIDTNDALPRTRRRRSETFRAQYINSKELRICVGTWNVGGKLPPDDLDIEGWLDSTEPADIYVIGFQEIIPLNAGNIFGAEDSRPVPKWENIIRETLNKIQPANNKFKCYSDPPSPSRFKPSEDAPDIENEILLETDSDGEEEMYPINEESNCFDEVQDGSATGENVFMSAETPVSSNDANLGMPIESELQRQFSSPKKLDRLNCFRTEDCTENVETSVSQFSKVLTKTLSGTERIGLSWPEPPLDLLAQRVLDRPNSFNPSNHSNLSGHIVLSTHLKMVIIECHWRQLCSQNLTLIPSCIVKEDLHMQG